MLAACFHVRMHRGRGRHPTAPASAPNQSLDRANDAGTRYVLDIKGSLTEAAFGACTAPPPKLKPAEAISKFKVIKAVAAQKFWVKSP